MSFVSLSDFLAMGGHGLYVWLSYGATGLVVLANVMALRISRGRFLRESRALERRAAAGVESARAEAATDTGNSKATGSGS